MPSRWSALPYDDALAQRVLDRIAVGEQRFTEAPMPGPETVAPEVPLTP